MTEKIASKKEQPVLKLKPVLHGFMLNEKAHFLSKGKSIKNILYYLFASKN